MEDNPIERWHGAHHYSDKIHLLFALFLFLGLATILWSYFELNSGRFAYRNSPGPTGVKSTPTPTCRPRPTCLDATPRCMIAETSDMCPPKSNDKNKVACTMEAKLCPDGSYVSRTGPNCEFSACPKKH